MATQSQTKAETLLNKYNILSHHFAIATGKTGRTFTSVIISPRIEALAPILANSRIFIAKRGQGQGRGQVDVTKVAAPARVTAAFVGVRAVTVLATGFW